MQLAEQQDFISVADYLAAEERSEERHEYLGGLVYAMAGETRAHNAIQLNLILVLGPHLRQGPCHLYTSDVRVNFHLRQDEYFYYPDLVVTCDPQDTHARFVHYPKLIIEVLSPSTERIDRREKFLAYTTIPSLEEYVLVAQETREAAAFRRDQEWRKEVVTLAGELTLASVGLTIPLAAIYQGL